MKKSGIRPAALLVDTIFSSDGVFADPAGFLRAGRRSRPGGRRAVHRRRGAARLRPHAASDVGLCRATASCPTSSPWASRWATAIRRRRWRRARSCWRSLAGVALLQHLRRQPGVRRRRHCGARRDRIRRVDAERATHRWLSGQIARAAAGAASIDRRNPRRRAIRRRRTAARWTNGSACHSGGRADREPAA